MSALNDSQKKSSPVSSHSREQEESLRTQNNRFKRTHSTGSDSKRSSVSNSGVRFRLGAYVRISPSDEVRDEGSLVSHPQRIKAFVQQKNDSNPGWGEIVEWYTDKDLSGGNLNRPALKQMFQDVKDGKINSIVFTELSRLSRDIHDFCQIRDFLKQHDAVFFSLKESFDTSTPMGEMMVFSMINFAQFERQTIIERIKNGSRARAERGLANGGQRVLGYDPDPMKRCHLVVNEPEAARVRELFTKFMELGSVTKLRVHLNEIGSRTKSYVTKDGKQTGGKRWTESCLHRCLTNFALIGKREINKANRHISDENLKEHDRYRMVDAAWPAIVDESVFWQVQGVLKDNQKSSRKQSRVYILRGFLECGLCGDALVGKAANGRNSKYFYYGHMRKLLTEGDRHLKRCELERIPAERIEEAVFGRLMEIAEDKKVLVQMAQDTLGKRAEHIKELTSLVQAKEQEKRNLQRQIGNLVSALADDPLGTASKTIKSQIGERESLLEQAIVALNEYQMEQSAEEKVVNIEPSFRLFQSFKKNFHSLSQVQQRDVLRDMLVKIIVTKNGIKEGYNLLFSGTLGEQGLGLDPFFDSDIKKDLVGEVPLARSVSNRTLVRPICCLVDTTGVEPATP